MSKAKNTTAADTQDLPAWFDPKIHHAGTGGAYETATGTLLDENGEPQSLALRIARAAQLARPEAPAAAPETPTPPANAVTE